MCPDCGYKYQCPCYACAMRRLDEGIMVTTWVSYVNEDGVDIEDCPMCNHSKSVYEWFEHDLELNYKNEIEDGN